MPGPDYGWSSIKVHIFVLQTTAPARARVLYERLVSFFPTSGRYWRLYIEQEVTPTFFISVHDLCLVLSEMCYAPVNLMSIIYNHDNESLNLSQKVSRKEQKC